MEITRNITYADEGMALLIAQYAGRPKIQAVLRSLLEQVQAAENSLFAMADGSLLANAKGATLDGYGELLGVARQALPDDSYRLFLLAAAAKNHGRATKADIETIAARLFQASVVVVSTPDSASRQGGMHGAFVFVQVGSPALPSRLWPLAQKLLAQVIGSGVELSVLTAFDANAAFALGSAGDARAPAYAGGLSSADGSVKGGALPTLLASAAS